MNVLLTSIVALIISFSISITSSLAEALIGARQVEKSTIAKMVIGNIVSQLPR